MTPLEIGLVILAVVLVAVVVLLWQRNRHRSEELKTRFGSEYDRTVHTVGDERKAEAALAEREKRVAKYHIRPLSGESRERFVESWRNVQARFVEDPHYAVTRADDLLGEVMAARGYPMSEFDQRADDLSVDHPDIVQSYRTAHEIAVRHSRGEANTEELRMAMIHYRALFDDLVNEPGAHDGDERHEHRHPVGRNQTQIG